MPLHSYHISTANATTPVKPQLASARVQVREEEERNALAAVKRNRRAGDVELDFDELKLVAGRFSRIGKAKSASGAAYRNMTSRVILHGARLSVPLSQLQNCMYRSAVLTHCACLVTVGSRARSSSL